MILSLRINNFILVDEIYMEFNKGLNIITGETGAGKSVIIGAINAIFDKKVKRDVLLDKTKKAFIEASFLVENDLPLLKKYDIEPENGEIFIAREFLPDGKKKSFINGRRISMDIALEFKNALFDFHNQNKHLAYLESSHQLELLDLAANTEENLKNYQDKYNEIIRLASKLKKTIEEEKAAKERVELYKYQLKELREANLTENEDESLEKEFMKLSNAEEILNIFNEISYNFYESENSVYDKISYKLKELENFSEDIDVVKEAKEYLSNILENLDNLISLSHKIEDVIYIDKEKLELVKDRLDIINNLKNKYGKEIKELISYMKEIESFIKEYTINFDFIEKAKDELKMKISDLYNLANELSEKRKEKAKLFEKEIENNLHRLSLEQAKFKITIDKNTAYKEILYNFKVPSIKGFDRIDFLFSANRGKKLQPIKIAASGGELSRIVLSIKKILAENFAGKTLIFDEIDVGIGGKTAVVTGEFISDIAKKSQVITVTHLARIASYAKTHYKIDKVEEKEKTKIYIERLDKKSRILEIARMLSGNSSQNAINHAIEILNNKE